MLGAVLHAKLDLRVEEIADAALAPDEVRVRVAFGGICGSDLHYFHSGAVGDFAIREPMVLGHEVSGVVVEVGAQVTGIPIGSKAALDPSRPCRCCEYCVHGRSNLCTQMRFLGSASRYPHVSGGFAQHLILHASQVIPVPDTTDLLKLSCAEPLSVALHAVRQAGHMFGRRVLITGSGPIGLLTVAAAVRAGASEVVATDVEDQPLKIACAMGATSTANVAKSSDGLRVFEEAAGYFEVAIEASGSPLALNSIFPLMKRGGRIIQLGMLPSGVTGLPVNLLQVRELELVGAFRASCEFRQAVHFIVNDLIDVSPILSGTFPLEEAESAFRRARDRTRVVKLHLAL